MTFRFLPAFAALASPAPAQEKAQPKPATATARAYGGRKTLAGTFGRTMRYTATGDVRAFIRDR